MGMAELGGRGGFSYRQSCKSLSYACQVLSGFDTCDAN